MSPSHQVSAAGAEFGRIIIGREVPDCNHMWDVCPDGMSEDISTNALAMEQVGLFLRDDGANTSLRLQKPLKP